LSQLIKQVSKQAKPKTTPVGMASVILPKMTSFQQQKYMKRSRKLLLLHRKTNKQKNHKEA
jgi:hypothetical protein